MSSNPLSAPGDLQPKAIINFNSRATLSRPINQPAIVDSPVGLVVFSDTTTIYLAQVVDPGAGVYAKLSTVKAKTYIHGWTVSTGRLYVLDGVELVAYDLRDGQKRETLALLKDAEAQKANEALADLQKALQRVEWATLLELAEDDWVRLTIVQNAAKPGTPERDKLDNSAADFFRMLRSLREITGSAGGGVAARQLVSDLRKALEEKRTAASVWCFSAPVVRRSSFEEPMRAVFAIQGDGRLHACDTALTASTSAKWKNHAELQLALVEDQKSPLRLLGYISNGALQVVDAKTLQEKSSWTPDPKPANGTTHTLTAVNGHFWWGVNSAIYGCVVDTLGAVRLAWNAGVPFTHRQIGRLIPPTTSFNPPVDPNQLFDTMNVNTWIEQRANKTVRLNDGMMSMLLLSDGTGKYKTPSAGTSYLVHGPFDRDPRTEHRWTQVKPHHSAQMICVSDSRGVSSFCRYGNLPSINELLPQWSVSPTLVTVVPHSPLDTTLSKEWPSTARRPLAKPQPDMIAWLKTSPAATVFNQFESLAKMLGRGAISDADVRLALWSGLFGPLPASTAMEMVLKNNDKPILNAVYNAAEQATLRTRFGEPGILWDKMPAEEAGRNYVAKAACVVNFDPPWINKPVTGNLFHTTPPVWYDPWGYNRPGDFITDQPTATYLDPFCFDKQLRLPQRPVTSLVSTFKGRSWAVFTDNEPALILKKDKAAAEGEPEPAPKPLRAAPDPNVLVVNADEDLQRTTLHVLAPKPLRITFDAASHTLRHEAKEYGSIANQALTAPVVYLNPASAAGTSPTAWCVTASDFPSARLRKLAETDDEGDSTWDKFLETNEAQYGPKDGTKKWQIDRCPLPSSVLPLIVLQGYGLPAN